MIRTLLTLLLMAGAVLPVRALTLTPGVEWPDATIPVCWETARRDRKQERDLIRKVVRWTWERESAVRFTGWRTCRPGDRGVRIGFDATYPRTAGRGRELDGVEGGVQLPTLWSLAALSVNMKAPVHEFGHVLGFGHEYARPDLPEPARCGAMVDGARYVEPDRALTPYDEHSIMVGCRPGATRRFSSGVPSLSAGDVFGVVRTYGSHPDNVLDPDENGDRFGAAVLAADMDGDGFADLAVGAPGEDEGRGAVYLFRGDPVKGLRPWQKVPAPDGAKGFGRDLPRLLSTTGADGRADALLLVASRNPSGHFGVLMSHPSAPPRRDMEVLDAWEKPAGPRPGALDRFAVALRATGPDDWPVTLADLDGDGLIDAMAGTPDALVDGIMSGAVVVFRGIPGGGFVEWYWFGQRY